jgi:UDP-N-acetylmuramate dehydrogenase
MNWWDDFAAICRPDEPLARHTWYGLGGPARWLLEPRNAGELGRVVRRLRDAGIPWNVLGCGANLLVSDEGYDGAVIRLTAPGFQRLETDDAFVRCGAGWEFPKLIRACLSHRRVGLEALAGIPGRLGGMVRMNAGGRYGEVGDFVRDIVVVDADGRVEARTRDRVGFHYRGTELSDTIVVDVTLALPEADPAPARERHQRIWKEKHDSQPALSQRSSGCVFKNPDGAPAGRLLDEAGLKSARVGGAEISSRHANFIVADANASARDVLTLIELARDRVRRHFGVELQLEVQVW